MEISKLLDATTLKVSYDIIYAAEGDLTALFLTYWHWRRQDPLCVRAGICGICGQLEAAGGTSGRRPRLSLTLVSITHSLITAGRSLEASSFCRRTPRSARGFPFWTFARRVIDAEEALATQLCIRVSQPVAIAHVQIRLGPLAPALCSVSPTQRGLGNS